MLRSAIWSLISFLYFMTSCRTETQIYIDECRQLDYPGARRWKCRTWQWRTKSQECETWQSRTNCWKHLPANFDVAAMATAWTVKAANDVTRTWIYIESLYLAATNSATNRVIGTCVTLTSGSWCGSRVNHSLNGSSDSVNGDLQSLCASEATALRRYTNLILLLLLLL